MARMASPLTTLENSPQIAAQMAQLVKDEQAAVIVVGLPRGLDGQHTEQTRIIETFVSAFKQHIDVPVYWQDEAVTSRKAEEELQKRGKPYQKGDIDALAATYILEDFLGEHPEIKA